MTCLALLAAAVVASHAVASQAAAATTSESSKDNVPPVGFAAIFNGRDLTGWKGIVAPNGGPPARAKLSAEELAHQQVAANQKMREHWHVDDGMLVFDGKGDSIATIKDYGNFELHLDWKIDRAGDSGIYLHATPQVQIWDPDFPDYEKMGAKKGSGALWNNKKNDRFPLVKADKPTGEWNRFRIKMVGQRVTVYLNDILVTNDVVLENYWEASKPVYPTGQTEIQAHLHPLYVKNVFVKELPKE